MNHSKSDLNINPQMFKSIEDQLQINYMNRQIDSNLNVNLKKQMSLINSSSSHSTSSAMLSPASFMSSRSSPSEHSSSPLDISSTLEDNKAMDDNYRAKEIHESLVRENSQSNEENKVLNKSSKDYKYDLEIVSSLTAQQNFSEIRKKYEKTRSLSPRNTNTLNKSLLTPSHKCKECFRTFKDINNYKEHRFQEHQCTEFPNVRKCSMCSYATLLKSKYDCHMRCHLNNKVIKCNRCSYSTINIRHMSRHERMHMIGNNSNANGANINNNNKPKYLHKTLNILKHKTYLKKDAKTKTDIKLKKKKLSLDEIHKKQTEKDDEIKTTSNTNENGQIAKYNENETSNENLYNLSMVAAATIAAINNTVNNSNSIAQNHQNNLNLNVKSKSFADAELEKSTVNNENGTHLNLMNLELIKNMLLNQMESQKMKKPTQNEETTSKQQTNPGNSSTPVSLKHNHYQDNKNQIEIDTEYSNLKYKISSITPPASSVSSTSSSPNGPKGNELHINQSIISSSPLNQNIQSIDEHSPSNSNFCPMFSPNLSSQSSFFSNQNQIEKHTSALWSNNSLNAQNESLLLYQTNFENLIKMQSISNLNNTNVMPPFYNTLLQNEFISNNSVPIYYNNSNNGGYQYQKDNNHNIQLRQDQMIHNYQSQLLQSKKKYEILPGTFKFDCESENPLRACKHKYELEKLRINVFKLIFNIMPHLITAFNLDIDSVHNSTHIDTLIDYLINSNYNNSKVNLI